MTAADTLRRLLPYPSIDSARALHPGADLRPASMCVRCAHRSCAALIEAQAGATEPVHEVCREGYSVVSLPLASGVLLINGVIVRSRNAVMGDRNVRRARRASWGRMVRLHKAIAAWTPIPERTPEVPRPPGSPLPDASGLLHDIKTAANLVNRNLEAFTQEKFGRKPAEDLGDYTTTRLAKSVELLNARLALASLLSNPSSAGNGQCVSTPVYRVFHRFVRLFEEVAADRGHRLEIRGPSEARVPLRRNIDTIPLVLIDNAIKYSFGGKPIVVTVMDSEGACTASVESYGYVVPKAEREQIFDQGIRGSNARGLEGSGLGLYLANIVAKAHGTAVRYAVEDEVSPSGAGKSIFSVRFTEAPGR